MWWVGKKTVKKNVTARVSNKQPGLFKARAKVLLRVLFPSSSAPLVCYTAVGFVLQLTIRLLPRNELVNWQTSLCINSERKTKMCLVFAVPNSAHHTNPGDTCHTGPAAAITCIKLLANKLLGWWSALPKLLHKSSSSKIFVFPLLPLSLYLVRGLEPWRKPYVTQKTEAFVVVSGRLCSAGACEKLANGRCDSICVKHLSVALSNAARSSKQWQ